MNDPVILATERQRAAADPATDAFVIANAGTGKTKVLVDRVTRLLLRDAKPDRILCLTYTKAAASEMQERLFTQLGDWSVTDDEALAAAIEKVTGTAPPKDDLAKARRLFARALETPGGLKVQTIHAFCERIVRQFPVEAGAPTGFRVLEEAEAARLASDARAEAARAAMADPDGPAAEAFRILAERVDDMTAESLFKEIVAKRVKLNAALTALGGYEGARAAAFGRLEIEPDLTAARIKQALWDALPRDALQRAHSALSAGGKTDVKCAEALNALFAAPDADAAFEALLAACLTGGGDVPARGVGTKGAREACPEIIDLFGDRDAPGSVTESLLMARDRLARLNCAELTAGVYALADVMIAAFERRKRLMRALDFSDLIEHARQLLTLSDAREWVRYKLDGGIDHILIDEAQDTAPDQWKLVDALTEEFFAGEGAAELDQTLFAVGDEKQSIYSFQGAQPAKFLEQTQNYIGLAAHAGRRAEQIPMETSFRSSPAILQGVDAVFDGETAAALLPERPPGGDIARHMSGRADREERCGAVELWPATPVPPEPVEENPWAPVDAPSPDNAQERLAREIAARVKAWLDDGLEVWERGRGYRAAHAGDVMILMRRRSGFFYEVIRQLKGAGVEVAGADRLKLTGQQAVRDLLSLARFALLPEDDLSLGETLKSPLFHPCNADAPPIDDNALFDLCHPRETYASVWSALQDTGDSRLTEAKSVLGEVLATVGVATPFAFFSNLLNRLGPEGQSFRKRILRRLGPEAEDAIDEFLSRALSHEGADAPSLQRFVCEMEADSSDVKRELLPGQQAVRVMTVHGSKGLESPVVILPDTTQTPKNRGLGLMKDEACGYLFSPYKSEDAGPAGELREAQEQRDYGEYLRLLYVAMTRAQDRLVVCGYRHGRRGKEGGPTEEGRIDEDSWYRLVETGLLRAEAEPVDTPLGDGLRLGETERTIARETPPETAAPLPGWIAAPAAPPERRAQSVAPSRLGEDEAAGTERPGFSPLEDETGLRYRRGNLIHKLLELLPEIEPERRDGAAEAWLDRQPDLDAQARADIRASVFGVLDDPAFAKVFGPGSKAEVAIVGESPELPTGQSINGQIDRLVVTDSEILIVDYKTNRPPPAKAEDADPAYIRQLAAYRAVLRGIFPGRAISCALLWTESGTLMELPAAMLDVALPARPAT